MRKVILSAAAPLLGLAACGGGGENQTEAARSDPTPGQAELAEDPDLANEAAADEAADIENFGGNAAALPANGQ